MTTWTRGLYANFLTAEYKVGGTNVSFNANFASLTSALVIDADGLKANATDPSGWTPYFTGAFLSTFLANANAGFTLVIAYKMGATAGGLEAFLVTLADTEANYLAGITNRAVDLSPPCTGVYIAPNGPGPITADSETPFTNGESAVSQSVLQYVPGDSLSVSTNGNAVATVSMAEVLDFTATGANPTVQLFQSGSPLPDQWTQVIGFYAHPGGVPVPTGLLPGLSTVGAVPPPTLPVPSVGGSRRWMALP